MNLRDPITEEWLREVGFRWHQFDRQPDKHWLLWLGDVVREDGKWAFTGYEDLGIELAPNRDGTWFCWMRSDAAGRYHRFIHIRHLKCVGEVIRLVVALSDCDWHPENHINGCALRPEQAERRRRDEERKDRVMLRHNVAAGFTWSGIEKDDNRGRPLAEHMQAAIDGGLAK